MPLRLRIVLVALIVGVVAVAAIGAGRGAKHPRPALHRTHTDSTTQARLRPPAKHRHHLD